jgi:glycogen synthase
VGGAAVFFADEGQLAERLRWAAGLVEEELTVWREKPRDHVAAGYSWDAAAERYLELPTGAGSR